MADKADYADSEQGDVDGLDEALKALQNATAALEKVRSHEKAEEGEEKSEGEPQPKSLKEAATKTREVFKAARKKAYQDSKSSAS